jgi:hypothetical protein
MMKEMGRQFAGMWHMYFRLADRIGEEHWRSEGPWYFSPCRIFLHIPASIAFYIGHESPYRDRFEDGWDQAAIDEFPSKDETLGYARTIRSALRDWLRSGDPDQENTEAPWAGPTRFSVAVFMLRHGMYHLGEIQAVAHRITGAQFDPWMPE